MAPASKPSKLQWEKGRLLGRGEFGTVSSGFLKVGRSRKPVAIKSATGSDDAIADLRREKDFLDQLDGCPQVIRCYGDATTYDNDDGKGEGEGEGKGKGKGETYSIFLDFAPKGSLDSYLPMHELSARRYVKSMLRGLAHIHRGQVVHCDIKPGNIMLWSRKEVKIIDFGLAQRSSEKSTTYRGSPYYLAPECVAKKEYGPPCDVWALGCTLSEMLTGEPALEYLDNLPLKEFLSLIAKGLARPNIPSSMSELGREFLRRCFEVDAAKRWTAEMLLAHPYMTELDDDDDDDADDDGDDVRDLRSWVVAKLLTCLSTIRSVMQKRPSLLGLTTWIDEFVSFFRLPD